MSTRLHNNAALPVLQEEDLNDATWNEVVNTRLPKNWQEKARELKAWQRQRGLRSIADLLRALLVYACCQYSVRELGMWAVLKGIGSLSERAWRKRLEQSEAWIAWLLNQVLAIHQTPTWLALEAGRILIVDASRFKLLAGCGDDVRLHLSYDLQAGQMEQVQLTDRHQAESLTHFGWQEGDLVITDAGYKVVTSVQQTQASKSYLLQRTSASHLAVQNEAGESVSLKERVQRQAADTLREFTAWLSLPGKGSRVPVRVLCYRLPEEQAKKARDRKEAKLKKKYGRKYNRELVWWASWVILVSTTDAAVWSGADLVRLYRARWQIELLFKRLKQCLRVHGLRLKDWHRASHVLRLLLLVWWLQEQEVQWMQQVLSGVLTPCAGEIRGVSEPEPTAQGESEEEDWVLSEWTLAHFCSEEVRTMLRGAWTRQRKEDCRAALQRYVRSHRPKRGHRSSEQRAWLQARSSCLAAGLAP
jgi:hypothetical protein